MSQALSVNNLRVLVASKFVKSRENAIFYLQKIGIQSNHIHQAENGFVVEYLTKVKHKKYNLIIIDYYLPGLTLEKFLASVNSKIGIILCYASRETLFQEIILPKNVVILLKPIRLEPLKLSIRETIEDINY